MAMSKDDLAKELEAMEPVPDEADGIENFANAFETYFYESECGGATANPDSLTAATEAMKTAMKGVANADGPTAIQAGIVAFWGIVATTASAIWTTAPPLASATPPPNLSTIAAATLVTGTANIVAENSLEDSAAAMAATIHPLNLGGFGVNTAVPPVNVPIL